MSLQYEMHIPDAITASRSTTAIRQAILDSFAELRAGVAANEIKANQVEAIAANIIALGQMSAQLLLADRVETAGWRHHDPDHP